MSRQSSIWIKTRKLFNDIHLWLGLISGIIIFVVCLSGTIYVFNTEAREAASPHWYNVNVPAEAQKINPEELISKLATVTGGKVASIKIPADPAASYTLGVRANGGSEKRGEERKGGKESGEGKGVREPGEQGKGEGGKKADATPKGAGPGGARPVAHFINPYTGELLGNAQQDKTFAAELMTTMFSLHRWLLLDKVEEPLFGELPNKKLGSYITGTATILFTLGVITGLVIWFPQRIRSWKRGLKINWKGSWKRTNHDLHNSLGFYSIIILFLMGVTGPQWSFEWYRDGLRKALGTYQAVDAPKEKVPKSVLRAGLNQPLMIAKYLEIADEHLNYPGDYMVAIPSDSTDAITITKTKTGFFAPVAGDKILLDQYTGEVLKIDIFSDKPFNERVSASIKALHIGDVYGKFSKIIYFIACLIATSLPITGTLIWINKMKKKPKRKISKVTLETV
jgi:uncharacterized iron-regulated membrane protein